ncbi:MAG: MBL fold metallo-hydrolase [Promethearchaeota archaeon]|nr:MAG: MBL fold metallo-hydrolase [Candidatus Lokiarchaeota archaeon]
MAEVKITILVDDINGAEKGYDLSYGFAALIEMNEKKILFDAGTKVPPLLNNLKLYGIAPSSIDALILTHNHYDHTDGMPGILEENHDLPIYIHKDWDRPATFKGVQPPRKNCIISKKAQEYSEICEGFYLTNSYKAGDYGGVYEHACYIKTGSSYILLTGCCHPGLNQFLEDRTQLRISNEDMLHIMGGFHGFKFSDVRAKNLDPIIQSIIICHCTMNAKVFREQFGTKCSIGIVGKTYLFK